MLMVDCISKEKQTSMDHTHLMPALSPAFLWVTASPKEMPTGVVQALISCQPHMLMGRLSPQQNTH